MTAEPGGADDSLVLGLFEAARRGRLDPDVELAALLSREDVSATDVAVALMRPVAPKPTGEGGAASDTDLDGRTGPSARPGTA